MTENPNIPPTSFTALEITRIDAVRGFLCFFIFCIHFYGSHMIANAEVFKRVFSEGYISVLVFFSLSGFLITQSFSKIQMDSTSGLWKTYFIKRFFRIFPGWFVVLIFYSLLKKQYDIGTFFKELFLLFGLLPFKLEDLTAFHSWSLYVEVIFYLSFPLIIYFLRHNLAAFGILFFMILKVFFQFKWVHQEGFLFNTPFNCFQYFFYGMAAYLYLPAVRKISIDLRLLYLCLFSTFIVLIYTQQSWYLTEVYIAIVFLFITTTQASFGQYFTWLFRTLGKYCYSFYLIHLASIWIAKDFLKITLKMNLAIVPLDTLIHFVFALALSIVGTLILYYLVERPFVRFGNRVIR